MRTKSDILFRLMMRWPIRALEAHKQRPVTVNPIKAFVDNFHFIEMDDADALKLGDRLETFGVVVSAFEPGRGGRCGICLKSLNSSRGSLGAERRGK
jgi:hypothetical protein